MKKIKSKAILSLLMILLFCSIYAQKKSLTADEKIYLKKFIYPLKSFEPNYPDQADLKVLDKFIGNSKIVALGEVSHGSSEIYKMKDRFIRYMVPHKDFSIFSLEAVMPESYLMNEYTLQGKGDPKIFLKDMRFWIWQTEEMLSMVEWMKKYNENTSKKVQFTGFDMQYYEGALEQMKSICISTGYPQENVDNFSTLLETITKQTQSKKSGKTDISETQKQALQTYFTDFRERSNKITDERERNRFLQNIRIIEQTTDKSYTKRDLYMAENIKWLHSQNPDSKIIISAHNGHINNHHLKMGSYLNRDFKDDYLTFGFAFYSGSYTAFNPSSGDVGTFPAQTAYEGTLENILNSLDIPIFILDLKSLKKENNEMARWITGNEIKFRQMGSTVTQKEFRDTHVADDFDYLIFIKESTNSKLLAK